MELYSDLKGTPTVGVSLSLGQSHSPWCASVPWLSLVGPCFTNVPTLLLSVFTSNACYHGNLQTRVGGAKEGCVTAFT